MTKPIRINFRKNINNDLVMEFCESDFDRIEVSATHIYFGGLSYPVDVMQRYMKILPYCCQFLKKPSTLKERKRVVKLIKNALRELDFTLQDDVTSTPENNL